MTHPLSVIVRGKVNTTLLTSPHLSFVARDFPGGCTQSAMHASHSLTVVSEFHYIDERPLFLSFRVLIWSLCKIQSKCCPDVCDG
jgi:hypothetical protein